MASSFITWFISSFLFIPFLLLLMGSDHVLLVAGRCREDQQSLLLQLKHGLNFSYPSFSRVTSWNSSTDCCEWPGIRCDPSGLGHVVGLDLSEELITGGGGLDDSSALFSLKYLEELDLSQNFFNTTIPAALANLTNLRYLDLYDAGFFGLDNSSALFSLKYLEELDLSYNEFNTTIPAALANLTNLRYLNLSNAGFFGQIPTALSQLSSLVSFRLSNLLDDLQLEIPNPALLFQNLTQLTELLLDGMDLSTQEKELFHVLSSSLPNLRVLSLSDCNLSAPIDPSLSKLQSLTELYLNHNNFSSLIPDIIQDFKNLTALSMSNCGLRGTFPKKIVQSLTQLEYLDFSDNQLVGNIPYAHWENIHNLVQVDLSDNFFNGTIPPSLFSIPSLKYIHLSNNQLAGPIPPSIFELSSLYSLDLSLNKFSGRVWFQTLHNLTYLDLSYNSLTLDASINKSSTVPTIPKLEELILRSCNLIIFPELGNQLSLSNLDLSDNNINGVVPRWIMNSTALDYLNLSHNNLVGFEVQHFASTPLFLDMHDNQLQGNFPFIPFPLPSSYIWYIDFSHNHLNGSIPAPIFNHHGLQFLSLSNNSFTGTIPTSMCDAVYLDVINLSNNHLNGTIPSCLIKTMKYLSVLDLSGNMFTGNIPNTSILIIF